MNTWVGPYDFQTCDNCKKQIAFINCSKCPEDKRNMCIICAYVFHHFEKHPFKFLIQGNKCSFCESDIAICSCIPCKSLFCKGCDETRHGALKHTRDKVELSDFLIESLKGLCTHIEQNLAGKPKTSESTEKKSSAPLSVPQDIEKKSGTPLPTVTEKPKIVSLVTVKKMDVSSLQSAAVKNQQSNAKKSPLFKFISAREFSPGGA